MADDTASGARKQRQLNWRDAVCDWCGETFQASRADAKYCSPSCRSKRWWRTGGEKPRKARYELTCQQCGEIFMAVFPHTKFCSAKCKAHSRPPLPKSLPLPPRNCAECDSEFNPKAKNGRFCSQMCGHKWHDRKTKEQRTAERGKVRAARVERKCPECGTALGPRKAGPFCSRLCSRLAWEREHPELVPARSKDHERASKWYAAAKADPARREALQQRSRERYAANREVIIERVRAWKHGADWREATEAFLDAQDGMCYLCGDQLDLATPRSVALDHDHACCARTSCEICRRGIACTPCNLAIGHAKDDPERLRRMADNLERANAAVRERKAAAEGVLFLAG